MSTPARSWLLSMLTTVTILSLFLTRNMIA